MLVQKESKTNKVPIKIVPLKSEPKPSEKCSSLKADPAYMDWSLGFGGDEPTAPSDPNAKREQSESTNKSSNVRVKAERVGKDGEKKLISRPLGKSDEWFPKPHVYRNPKVPPSEKREESNKCSRSRILDWVPRVVLTEVQVKEKGCSEHSTRGGFSGHKEECRSRIEDDRDHRTTTVKTYREDRRCISGKGGQIVNFQQSMKLLEPVLPIRKYKFPRPLDGPKRRK